MHKLSAICLGLILTVPGVGLAQTVRVLDFSSIYEQASPAIVTVHTESGNGSGFLVTRLGHIVTNFHVIRDSNYLAVQFGNGMKIRGEVVAVNELADLALLKVNSTTVEGITPLPIAPESKDASIKVGSPVVAIGSPQLQDFVMTQGILSKATETTLLGDFVLQPGNSGGPLLNLDGEVIGVNTFADGQFAGAVRIEPLREVMHSAALEETATIEPPPDFLPALSEDRYPVALLNHKLATEPLNFEAYQFTAGNFDITTITPVFIGKIQVLKDRMRAAKQAVRQSGSQNPPTVHFADDGFYAWHETAGSGLAFAVRFDIQPKTGHAAADWSDTLSSFLTFGLAGETDLEFKGEFLEFRLFRDDKFIEPITPGRYLIPGFSEGDEFIDQAFGGNYVYDPIEFMQDGTFRVEIVDARTPDRIHASITLDENSPVLRQIRSDFSY